MLFVLQIQGFLKVKSSFEEVSKAVQTAPIAVNGIQKLIEGCRGMQAWRAKYEECTKDSDILELRDLESLVHEGSRLPVLIPELKVCDLL